jgi:Sodium:sulfate symporter transmembrane region
MLVKRMGHRTLLLGYGIALADTILAPFTPSNTARSGGTLYPIISQFALSLQILAERPFGAPHRFLYHVGRDRLDMRYQFAIPDRARPEPASN